MNRRHHRCMLHYFLLVIFLIHQAVALEDDTASTPLETLNSTVTPTTTGMPSMPPSQDPFTLRRPLKTVQVRLLGAYNAGRREELLDSLKIILQDSLYDSLEGYFQADDSPEEEEQTTNSTTQVPQPRAGQSILSTVSLEWTSTKFQIDGDPFLHILQASGNLGFSQYDYALLHPETILPMQENIMSGNTTKTIALSKIELSLRRKHFFFQVLQFITVEPDDEHPPTQVPTKWEFVAYDDDTISTIIDIKDNITLDDDGHDADADHNNHSADTDDNSDEEPLNASDDTIGIAVIVSCVVSAVAFFIFMRYVCIKSKRIQSDRMMRKESLALGGVGQEKGGNVNENGVVDDENDQHTADATLAAASFDSISSAASAPTSASNMKSQSDVEVGDTTANEEASAQATANPTQYVSTKEEDDSKISAGTNWGMVMGGNVYSSELQAAAEEKKSQQPPGWRLPFCSNVSPAKKSNAKYMEMSEELVDL